MMKRMELDVRLRRSEAAQPASPLAPLGLCKVIFTFLFLKVRKVASHFIQDGGQHSNQ